MYCCMCGRDLTDVWYEPAGAVSHEYICLDCLRKIKGGRHDRSIGEKYTID